MITLDPFLHEWDERFHALVAKNMITSPFKPMLRVDPVGGWVPKAWCCNHVWVHKQPLFLWQIALSLKIFGLKVWAVRVPSAILGALSILLSYDITRLWTRNKIASITAAALTCFSYFQLELISGRLSLEHNDLSFYFYVSASIWAFLKYRENLRIRWAVLVGLCVGAAILVKWMTGLIVYGGWGLFILSNNQSRLSLKHYLHLSLSMIISILVFLPWQVYISLAFPIESAVTHDSNWTHITEAIGHHSGDLWFHIIAIRDTLGIHLIPFLLIGIIRLFTDHRISNRINLSHLSMITVVILFFTFVKTKMPAFTYVINILLISICALGISAVFDLLKRILGFYYIYLFTFVPMLIYIIFLTFNPLDIIKYREDTNLLRAAKITNTEFYKGMDKTVKKNTVILNPKKFEGVEILFYQDYKLYNWFPNQKKLDSLINEGYNFAAFTNNKYYDMPNHIKIDPRVQKISYEIK